MPIKHRLRPAPEHLQRMRYGATPRWYARFYANYETMTGNLRRLSFQVKVSPELTKNRRVLADNIRETVSALLDNYVPEHEQGDTFYSFEELMEETRWFRVRKLRNYEAGVVYGR